MSRSYLFKIYSVIYNRFINRIYLLHGGHNQLLQKVLHVVRGEIQSLLILFLVSRVT